MTITSLNLTGASFSLYNPSANYVWRTLKKSNKNKHYILAFIVRYFKFVVLQLNAKYILIKNYKKKLSSARAIVQYI